MFYSRAGTQKFHKLAIYNYYFPLSLLHFFLFGERINFFPSLHLPSLYLIVHLSFANFTPGISIFSCHNSLAIHLIEMAIQHVKLSEALAHRKAKDIVVVVVALNESFL